MQFVHLQLVCFGHMHKLVHMLMERPVRARALFFCVHVRALSHMYVCVSACTNDELMN